MTQIEDSRKYNHAKVQASFPAVASDWTAEDYARWADETQRVVNIGLPLSVIRSYGIKIGDGSNLNPRDFQRIGFSVLEEIGSDALLADSWVDYYTREVCFEIYDKSLPIVPEGERTPSRTVPFEKWAKYIKPGNAITDSQG